MDMARRRIDLRLDEELLARLDAEAERLGQTRTKFVERALESALAAIPHRSAEDIDTYKKVWDSPEFQKQMLADDTILDAVPPKRTPGVKSARELAMERQRKMNERKS